MSVSSLERCSSDRRRFYQERMTCKPCNSYFLSAFEAAVAWASARVVTPPPRATAMRYGCPPMRELSQQPTQMFLILQVQSLLVEHALAVCLPAQ